MVAKTRIELWESSKNGRWYFHKVAANNKVTENSQGYKKRKYALVAIKRDFPGIPVVEITHI